MSNLNCQKKSLISSSAAAFVLAFFSPVFPLLAIFSGAAAAVMCINSKKAYLPAAFFVITSGYFYGGSLLFGSGIYFAIVLEALCFIPMLLFAITFSKAVKFKYTVIITSFAIGISLCGIAMLYVWQRGGEISLKGIESAFSWFTEAFNANMEATVAFLKEQGNTALADKYSDMYEALKTSVLKYYIPMFPSLCIMLGFVFATPSALFIKNSAHRADVQKIGRLSDFGSDRLLSIIMLAAYLVSVFVGEDAFGVTLCNFVTVGLCYFAVSGFGFISFMMNIRKTKTSTRYIVYVIICTLCFLTAGLDMIAMLGILEGILQTRVKLIKTVKRYGFDPEKDSLSEILEKMREKIERGEMPPREDEVPKEPDIPWYERDEYKTPQDGEENEDKENKE